MPVAFLLLKLIQSLSDGGIWWSSHVAMLLLLSLPLRRCCRYDQRNPFQLRCPIIFVEVLATTLSIHRFQCNTGMQYIWTENEIRLSLKVNLR